MAQIMNVLHKANIVKLNLKPEKFILVKGVLKLIGFGATKNQRDNKVFYQIPCIDP